MLYTIQNESLKIRVAPFGAVLTSVQSSKSGHEFLYTDYVDLQRFTRIMTIDTKELGQLNLCESV